LKARYVQLPRKDALILTVPQEEEKRGGKKGRLLGVITLSDVLRYVIGELGIGEGAEEAS
jgi:5'-AMP-activated protein kinase, regulatory gamma subunit